MTYEELNWCHSQLIKTKEGEKKAQEDAINNAKMKRVSQPKLAPPGGSKKGRGRRR